MGGVHQALKTRLRNRTTLLILVILAAALFVRIINLDADPSALISRDFVTDEGWWAHNARNAFFYDQWRIDEYNLPLYSAYLYNLLLFAVFKLFGVSFTTLRILSAVGGWLTVVLLFVLVRREINTRAAVFASALLGFSNLHIVYSRTGFTESVMVLLLVLALWLWSLKRVHYFFAFLSGISVALMVVTKITAIYFVPGLVLAGVATAVRRSVTRREALVFLSGIGLIGTAYTALFVLPNFHAWLSLNLQNGSGSEWSTKSSSLLDSIPRLLGSPFYAEVPLITALTALSLLLIVVTASRNGLTKAIREACELETNSATLLIGYLLSLSLTQYQPERRFLPALTLMVALSASILERGWASLAELADGDHKMGAIGWFITLFFLPVIGILKLKWRLLGPTSSAGHWAAKAAVITALVAIAIGLSRGWWSHRVKKSLSVACVTIFVLLFSFLSLFLIYKALLLWGLDAGSWESAFIHTPAILLVGLTMMLACIGFIYASARSGKSRVIWFLGAFLLVEGAQISTWLSQPTYTLKKADEFLATTLGREDTVVTHYETFLISSAARVICKSVRRGFNVDAFEKFNPQYILVLRRDDWKDYLPEDTPVEESPSPAGFATDEIASFDLCPARRVGPRFIAVLYRLSPRLKQHKKPSKEVDETLN
jgi:4-amino-4-deoxy-L-arabinose transferase-like glycosyltransferase